MHSQKGFNYAMISLLLVVLAFLATSLSIRFKNETLSLASGILIIVLGILSIIGFMASLKGIKEKDTIKQWIGLIINTLFLVSFIVIILANIYDIIKAFA